MRSTYVTRRTPDLGTFNDLLFPHRGKFTRKEVTDEAIKNGADTKTARALAEKVCGTNEPLTREEMMLMAPTEPMATMPTRWERLEAWLFDMWFRDSDGEPDESKTFMNADVAKGMGVPTYEASALITAYLDAQRGKNSTTLYVLKRSGRTSTAVWSAGSRTDDARKISRMFFEDVVVKAERGFEPDLNRIAEKNPHAARYAKARIGAVLHGALVTLAAALDTYYDDEEE